MDLNDNVTSSDLQASERVRNPTGFASKTLHKLDPSGSSSPSPSKRSRSSPCVSEVSSPVAPPRDSEAAHVSEVKERVKRGCQDVTAVPGLLYVADFLLPREEALLLQHIDSAEWSAALKRRVQHYGWVYNYKQRKVSPDDYKGPLPEWAAHVAKRLRVCGIVDQKTEFDQVIVNEYLPGQGIAPHIDQPQFFGPEIVTVSLGSATTMDLTSTNPGDAHDVQSRSKSLRLQPCSVARFRKKARYSWKHGIVPRKTDPVHAEDGTVKRVARARRVSLTFREVQKE